MKYSKYLNVGAVVLLAAALVGNIVGQGLQKERQVALITSAVDEIDKLINIHYETTITDLSDADGESGIETEVWADFDSEKWAAVYSSKTGEDALVYQEQMYNGIDCYSKSSEEEQWQEEEDSATGIPNLSALKEFYYNEDDLTNIQISEENGMTVISAELTAEALEEAYQSGISSAQLSYEFYQENDPDSADTAALLVESAKNTQIDSIGVSYTIDTEGVLVESTLIQQYSSPEILNIDGTASLGDAQLHTVTYEKKVISYNSADATNTLKEFFHELDV